MLMNYLAKFLSVHVQKINENIVQLMFGFDRTTKDNEHLLRLQLWFYLNDPVTIMIFDTDHKLPTYLQNVILIFIL